MPFIAFQTPPNAAAVRSSNDLFENALRHSSVASEGPVGGSSSWGASRGPRSVARYVAIYVPPRAGEGRDQHDGGLGNAQRGGGERVRKCSRTAKRLETGGSRSSGPGRICDDHVRPVDVQLESRQRQGHTGRARLGARLRR